MTLLPLAWQSHLKDTTKQVPQLDAYPSLYPVGGCIVNVKGASRTKMRLP